MKRKVEVARFLIRIEKAKKEPHEAILALNRLNQLTLPLQTIFS
jgi:hypothetical protein